MITKTKEENSELQVLKRDFSDEKEKQVKTTWLSDLLIWLLLPTLKS